MIRFFWFLPYSLPWDNTSPSYVREPQCNGVAERFIKTLKEQLLHIFYFETIEDLRCALLDFKEKYNLRYLAKMPLHLCDEEERTPLHLAARYGQVKLVEWLCANGAPISQKDRWGKTALSIAEQYEHYDVVKIISRAIGTS